MPMTPSDRKAELVRRRRTITEIAASLGVSIAHVSMVVSGQRRSARIEQAVADAVEKPVAEVFGSPDEPDEPAAAVA